MTAAPWTFETISGKTTGGFRFAVFDFDGTISLIRQGWQEVMKSYFVEVMTEQLPGADKAELASCVDDFVDYNTGKQTIYQCIALHDELKRRGAMALEPQDYKDEYHRRLLERIDYRLAGLEAGKLDPRDWVVPGSLELLEALKAQGLRLYLASGTDEAYVLSEARLLGVTGYFDGIHGAQREYKLFSKKKVIEDIIRRHELAGPELLGFGDGYVEIENVREAGGFAVGVASDELHRSGVDEWKRNRLTKAGADVIIPDYAETDKLMKYLFAGEAYAV